MTITETDALIKQWRCSATRPKQVAAELAAKIVGGQMHAWQALPTADELAVAYDTSSSTIRRARRLLADHGFMELEARRYYVVRAERT